MIADRANLCAPVPLAEKATAFPRALLTTAYLVQSEAGLTNLRVDWDKLYEAAGGGLPFLQWEWMWHWWRTFGQGGRSHRNRLHVLVVREQDTPRAILPFVLTTWGRGLCAVRLLRLYGFEERLTEIRPPLVTPGWEAATGEAVLTMLDARPQGCSVCLLDGLDEKGPLGTWFAGHAPGGSWGPRLPYYVRSLPDSWENFRRSLTRNGKESLRHAYNALTRDGHSWRFERAETPFALQSALNDFFRLHAARHSMAGAHPHPDYFAAPASRAFLRSLAADLAVDGRFQVCQLLIGTQVVASQVLYRAGDILYLAHSGFDPAWRRYNVMTTLTAECFQWAITSGIRTVHLSTGKDQGKSRWAPEERICRRLYLTTRNPRTRALVALYQGLLEKSRQSD